MLTSWISKQTLHEWVCRYIELDPLKVNAVYPFLCSTLRFKFNPLYGCGNSCIRYNNSFVIALFSRVESVEDLQSCCVLFKTLSQHGVPAVHGKKRYFLNDLHPLFRLAWQLPAASFDELLFNLSTHCSTTLCLFSENGSSARYYRELFNGPRPRHQVVCAPVVRERWLRLFEVLVAKDHQPERMLNTRLQYCPRYVTYCMYPLF